jgi:RNA polymerase-binding protein DksA
MDLDSLRADLDQIVRETEAAIAAMEAEQAEDADEATDSEADREEALVEAAQERRAEAVAALARIDAGSYGVCVDCGETIGVERLEFRPEAARCLACQEKFEQL